MKYQILNKTDNSLHPCATEFTREIEVGEGIFMTVLDAQTFDPMWMKYTHIGNGILTLDTFS